MSDTTNLPPTEEPQPTPAPPPAPTDAPPQEQEEGGQPRDELGRFKVDENQARFDRRLGVFRAQISQLARERDQVAARLAALEQGRVAGQQPQVDPHLQAYINQQAEQIAEQKDIQQRIVSFHQDGAQRYADWQTRCNDLQGMGADAQFAQLLVKMPDGARVAGALRDDPEEVERIAALPHDARAFALGQYAAKLESHPTRQVSRAPAPPRPLPGRSAPQPNIYQMDANDLAQMWMKQVLDSQRRQ